MRQFEKLRALRTFRNEHADIFSTLEGHHLISEIGFHQTNGEPLTLKQLFLLDIGSISTVQRRLRRLKELGFVRHRQSPGDRRTVELTLSPRCLRVFAQYDALMSSKPVKDPAPERGESRHLCGLCDSDAGRRSIFGTFLAQGLKRGDSCILVAPAEIQNEILATLPHRRRASERLLVSDGEDTADAQIALLKRIALAARRTGRRVCLAADMSWALSRNLTIDAVLDIEMRLDAMARRLRLTALCVYDTRHFSGGDFLQAVKCHRDHVRCPVVFA
jgi:DNA-binding MarR family transcriptional regulator